MMVQSLPQMSQSFALFFLDMASKTTFLLMVLALADHFLGRRHASWRSLLWRMGVVGLLLIPLASVALPDLRIPISTETAQMPGVGTVFKQTKAGAEKLEKRGLSGLPPTDPLSLSASMPTDASANLASFSAAEPEHARSLADFSLAQWSLMAALSIYLIGLIYLLSSLASSLVCVSALRHQVRQVDEPLALNALQRFTCALGIRRSIELATSEQVSGPTQAGCLTPVIVVPAETLHRQDRQSIAAIIAHELGHVSTFSTCSFGWSWRCTGSIRWPGGLLAGWAMPVSRPATTGRSN